MGTMSSKGRAARRAWLALAALSLPAGMPRAQPASAAATPPPPLFLAQLSLGPGWEANKPPQEQAGFREHSANLARMRRSGAMLFGARTKALGWMILTATDLESAKREFADDPMVQRQAFALEVEPLMAFYRGALGASVPR